MCLVCSWGGYKAFMPQAARPSRRGVLGAGLAAALVAGPAEAEPSTGPADLIFRNGAVYTMEPTRPWARAVAVRGSRIIHVGGEDGLAALTVPRTRVVDLAGRMLLPGFVEAHIHPLTGATITRGVDLQFDTREEILAALRAWKERTGPVPVVRGFGWRYNAFPAAGPRKEDLDALWPDTPVLLVAIDGHGAWVNSKGLAVAGVTRETPDPIPGFSFFQRDPATGEATGFLAEPPVMLQVSNAIEPFTPERVAQALTEWLPQASAAGITTVFDAGMQVVPEATGFGIYQELERAGRLPFRVVGSYYHNDPAIDPVPIIQGLRRRFRSPLVRASVLKLNMDGGDNAHTGVFLAPYADRPETSGEPLVPPERFADIVRRADRAGIDIHVHCIGDRATRLTLDAIEAAIRRNPPRERRNAIAHLTLVDPADEPRFARLGVVGQFSAQWAVADQPWEKVSRARLGPERADRLYRIGALVRAGGRAAFGSDWPAANSYSTYRPLDAIEVAMTRRELDRPEARPLPPEDDVIPLAEALRAATIAGAWQLRMENEIGSIEPGKRADLVVLERNLFEVPVREIHTVKVAMTVMNGVVRHG
jgi:predicted amidohydrolase YtcJ